MGDHLITSITAAAHLKLVTHPGWRKPWGCDGPHREAERSDDIQLAYSLICFVYSEKTNNIIYIYTYIIYTHKACDLQKTQELHAIPLYDIAFMHHTHFSTKTIEVKDMDRIWIALLASKSLAKSQEDGGCSWLISILWNDQRPCHGLSRSNKIFWTKLSFLGSCPSKQCTSKYA